MKRSSTLLLSAALLSLSWAGASSLQVRAEDSGVQNEYNEQYRSYYDVPLGSNYTGKSPYMRPTGERPPPPPPPAPKPVAVAQAPKLPPMQQPCSAPTGGLIQMSKKMPAEVSLGQEFMYELDTTAMGCAGNVTVTDRVPAGASYVRSEPPAEVQGDQLVWHLKDMDAGEARNIKVWLKPEQEGRLASCATVSADPRTCASTMVGKPALAITKTGPETAQIGSQVTYNIQVSNPGSAVAHNVVVTDDVPEGLSHSSGQRQLSFNVGDLGPGQAKTMTVTLQADKRGKVCNGAVAASSDAGQVKAEACTTIVQPGLKIVKTGDKEQYVGKRGKYNIVVSNTGDTTLTGVVVTDSAAPQTAIVEAPDASINGNTATWNIGSLAPGAEKQFNVVLSANTSGNFCNTASVATAEGLRDSSQACTDWRGVSALLLEKGDNPDPIQIGETTTYYVRVTNQGNAADADVKVVVEFPAELTPVSADNGGQVNGQTVTFPPVPTLEPKQAFEYHVVAKGAQAGDARVKFIRTSRDIPAPTTAEESTRVY